MTQWLSWIQVPELVSALYRQMTHRLYWRVFVFTVFLTILVLTALLAWPQEPAQYDMYGGFVR